jgi:hypothetical protein
MKTIEYNHGNNWLDKLLNAWPLCLDVGDVATLFSFAYCKQSGNWIWERGELAGSMYRNGVFFARYTVTPLTPVWAWFVFLLCFFCSLWFLPLFTYGLFVHISWRETGKDRYLQIGWGHKINGRFATLFRVLDDVGGMKGEHGINFGQATGWECGPK